MSWIVAQSFSHCENRIIEELVRLEIEAFMPLIRVWRRSRYKRRPILQELPAFPGYLFIRSGSAIFSAGSVDRWTWSFDMAANRWKFEIDARFHKWSFDKDLKFLTVDGKYAEISDIQGDALRARGFIIDEGLSAPDRRKHFQRGAHVGANHAMFGACAGMIIHCGAIYAEIELDVNRMRLKIPVEQLEEIPKKLAS